MIIVIIINMESAFRWASRIDLTLHLSQHDDNRRIVQILVLLLFVVFECCRIGISSNDITLEVVHLCIHCPLVMEMAYTVPWF